MPSGQRGVHSGCGLIPQSGQDVAVAVDGHRDGAVAEEILYQLRVHPLRQKQRRRRVAQIVKN